MSEDADPAREETPEAPPPEAPAAEEPEWKNDEYLTSGRRFVRWNLLSFAAGLAALGAGALYLNMKG